MFHLYVIIAYNAIVPFLLPPFLHFISSFSEAVTKELLALNCLQRTFSTNQVKKILCSA